MCNLSSSGLKIHGLYLHKWFSYAVVTREIKLFQCFISHVTAFEIISKLFQPLTLFLNNFGGVLQLVVNIFQHVQCR